MFEALLGWGRGPKGLGWGVTGAQEGASELSGHGSEWEKGAWINRELGRLGPGE